MNTRKQEVQSQFVQSVANMKPGILILVVLTACAVAETAINDNCVCSQWTCTTNQCEAPPAPARDCKPKGRGRVNENTYEEDDGQFVYMIQTEPRKSWDDSLQACKDAGFTHLATLDTEAKRVWFDGMYTRSGLRGATTCDKQLWSAFNNKGGSGFNWAPSGSTAFPSNWWEPGNPSGDGVCVAITANTTYNDGACTSPLGRLCMAPLCAGSGSGGGGSGGSVGNVRCKTSRGGTLFAQGINEASDGSFVYSIQDDKTNRGDALVKCQNDGFTGLAYISTDAQFRFINNILQQAGKKNGSDQFWLSLNGIGRPVLDFIWPETGSQNFGSWWYPGKPNGVAQCGSIMAQLGKLNNLDCTTYLMPRICMAPDCAAVGGTPEGPTPKTCGVKGRGRIDPTTWEEDDGEYIYQIQLLPHVGWAAGLQICQAGGFTHLATLDTEEKNQFYVDMLTRSGHRGASLYDPQLWTSWTNRARTGFKWETTGSTYWNNTWWGPSEPNGDGQCGAVGIYGTYNDAPCEFGTGRICQKPCN